MGATKDFVTRTAPVLMWMVQPLLTRLEAAWNAPAAKAKSPAARLQDLLKAADTEIATCRDSYPYQVPCKAGCNSCCTAFNILASDLEIQAMVQHIKKLPSPQQELVIANIKSASATGAQKGVPCAMLGASGCQVYESRPLICRGYLGINRQDCEKYASGQRCSSPDGRPSVVGTAIVVQFAVGEVSRKWRSRYYEVNTMLARIFGDEDLLQQWLTGQPTIEHDLLLSQEDIRAGA